MLWRREQTDAVASPREQASSHGKAMILAREVFVDDVRGQPRVDEELPCLALGHALGDEAGQLTVHACDLTSGDVAAPSDRVVVVTSKGPFCGRDVGDRRDGQGSPS